MPGADHRWGCSLWRVNKCFSFQQIPFISPTPFLLSLLSFEAIAHSALKIGQVGLLISRRIQLFVLSTRSSPRCLLQESRGLQCSHQPCRKHRCHCPSGPSGRGSAASPSCKVRDHIAQAASRKTPEAPVWKGPTLLHLTRRWDPQLHHLRS